MHRRIFALGAAIAALALLVTASPAEAQRRQSITIAVVDVATVMQNSEAAKSVRAQMERLSKTYQAAITPQKEKLTKEQQELEQQRSVLAPDALQQKQREFQKKVADYERDLQSRQRRFDQAYGGAMHQVQAALINVVDQIAKESNFSLVLTKTEVLHAAPELDITQEVLKRLNAKLSSVTVQVPKE